MGEDNVYAVDFETFVNLYEPWYNETHKNEEGGAKTFAELGFGIIINCCKNISPIASTIKTK